MSEHVLKQNSNLNDSIERTNSVDSGETVSIGSLSKDILKFLKQKSVASFNFLVELAEEINKVRAESERYYSRTRW